jgi:hypothetical protein
MLTLPDEDGAIDYDIRERFWWGGEPILDKIRAGSDHYRKVISSL